MAETKNTTKQTTSDKELQEEFDALKTQVSDLMVLLKEKGEQKTSNLKGDLSKQFIDYEKQVKEQISNLNEIGTEKIEKVGEHVKEKPVASLLMAFGIGYLISKTLSNK